MTAIIISISAILISLLSIQIINKYTVDNNLKDRGLPRYKNPPKPPIRQYDCNGKVMRTRCSQPSVDNTIKPPKGNNF